MRNVNDVGIESMTMCNVYEVTKANLWFCVGVVLIQIQYRKSQSRCFSL